MLAWIVLPVHAQTEVEPDESLRAFIQEYVAAINTKNLEQRDANCRKLVHFKCLAAMASKKYAGYMEGLFAGVRLTPAIGEPYTLVVQVLDQDYFRRAASAYTLVVEPTHGITIQDRVQAESPRPNRWVFAVKEEGKWMWVIQFPTDKQLAESGL